MSEIDDIKQKIDLVEFIGNYVPLKRAGVNYKGLCPFHQEKTPSFMVSSEKQIWHCFGCHEGGDAFSFLMKMENLEFGDALKMLAEKTGVKLSRTNVALSQQKSRFFEVNQMAADFFHHVLLKTKIGAKARKYLKDRGVSSQSIQDFRLGYSLNSFRATGQALRKKGFAENEIRESGLAIPRLSGQGSYDRFRGRIMFPIADQMGKVIGFTGRAFADETGAKYINSPDTPIYNKSQVLYGLDRAKQAIKQKKYAVLVEGNMDVIACHQAGFTNTIASSGTAITPNQLAILKRFCANLILALDSDSAGIAATKRLIVLALRSGFNLRIIKPESAGKDPDDYLKQGQQVWAKMLKNSISPIEYYFAVDFKGQKTDSISIKRENASEVLQLIKEIADPIIKGEFVTKLASLLQIDEKYIIESLNQAKPLDLSQPADQSSQRKISLEDRLMALSVKLNYPAKQLNLLKEADFGDADWLELYKIWQSHYNQHKKTSSKTDEVLKLKQHPKISKRLDTLLLLIEDEFVDFSGEELAKAYQQELQFCVARKIADRSDRLKQKYVQKLKQAESSGDRGEVKKLLKQFQQDLSQIKTGEEHEKNVS